MRAVFSLGSKALETLFPPTGPQPPKFLAYVEWFTPFTAEPDPAHRLYRLTRALRDGQRLASIVPVAYVLQSVHLWPQFGARVPRDWTSDNVLDECPSFFVSPFANRYNHINIQ